MSRPLTLTACAVAVLLSLAVDPARAGGRHYGGGGVVVGGYYGNWHGGHRPYWGGVSIGIAAPLYYPYGGYGYGYGYGYPYVGGTWVSPAPVVAQPVPPAAPMPPAPTLVPRDGQDATQTEIDRRACDRWAVSQPAALADAQVFHRITLACMEQRGYAVR